MTVPTGSILVLDQSSFSNWSDQDALNFGVQMQKKKKNLYIYCIAYPCTVYEVGTIIPILQMKKKPREAK